jgi:hypothetical protein
LGACCWLVVACGFNLLSLLSHYNDGSRYDYRTAAHYIEGHWHAGDRVAAVAGSSLPIYASVCDPTIHLPPKNPLPEITNLCTGQDRLWIVLNSDRGGKERKLDSWLRAHCSHELEVRQKRYDYRDYVVDVFLYPAVSQNRQ